MQIVIIPNEKDFPAGKLADAELHFDDGPLAGLRLVGFGIWESQWPGKSRHQFLRVTVPSRTYTAGGEERRYDLLRGAGDASDKSAADPIRDAILDAYAESHGGPIAQAQATVRQVASAVQAGRPAAPKPPARPQPASRPQPPARPPQPRRPAAPRGWTSVDTSVEPPPHTDSDMPF